VQTGDREDSMKGIPAIVLATLAVLYSLIVLLSVDRTSNSVSVNNQERISDLGLRFTLKR
jgi:hypothetical protein